MSRRLSNDSTKSSSSGIGRRGTKLLKPDTKDEFNWDKYLQQSGMTAAPAEYFKQQVFDDSMPNKFKVSDKLEAKDARNLAAISVATVVSIQGPRLCLRLDGTDGCNNFWRLIDSKDIFPIGTCEAHGGLLQPPLGFTRNVSTWPTFLQRTLNNAKNNHANSDCFYQEPEGPDRNLFEIGMKLEAVDKKNAQLICPATIGDVDGDQIFISFDGWRGAFDYWSNYNCRDLFPVGWCQANNHPLQVPGQKGDNPVVCEKLKAVAQESKRQTRSVKNNLELKPPVKETPTPTQAKEKPVRRRRVDSIKASSLDKDDAEFSKDMEVDLSNDPSPCAAVSDGSYSSDDSESSHEEVPEKRSRPNIEEESSTASQFTPNKSNASSAVQYTDEDLMKLQRKARKQKRKQRKLAKALKRAGIAEGQIGEIKEDSIEVSLNLTPQQIALLTSPRKRSLDNEFVKSKLKKKKKRRSLMESSSYTRMEGFGMKSNDVTVTTSTTSPTSPSFLDALTTPPPSLFGGDKSQIVRDATQGWPARLQMGSVVTSDNKLGRFDKTVPEKPQEAKEPSKEVPSVDVQPEVVTSQCVSTTTNEAERTNFSPQDNPESSSSTKPVPLVDRTPPSPFVTSTTTTDADERGASDENNDDVSSTTNPPSSSNSKRETSSSLEKVVALPPSSLVQPPVMKVSSTVTSSPPSPGHVRSRNPIKWSIHDVMSFVREKEPALSGHLALFQKHQIDGRALLLLNSNNIVKYMELKLGPALKLCNLVEKLKAFLERHARHKIRKQTSETER